MDLSVHHFGVLVTFILSGQNIANSRSCHWFKFLEGLEADNKSFSVDSKEEETQKGKAVAQLAEVPPD
jgi:hypothetical protein